MDPMGHGTEVSEVTPRFLPAVMEGQSHPLTEMAKTVGELT